MRRWRPSLWKGISPPSSFFTRYGRETFKRSALYDGSSAAGSNLRIIARFGKTWLHKKKSANMADLFINSENLLRRGHHPLSLVFGSSVLGIKTSLQKLPKLPLSGSRYENFQRCLSGALTKIFLNAKRSKSLKMETQQPLVLIVPYSVLKKNPLT